MTTAIQDLITLSRRVGNQLDLVQGGGGNTSVKDGNYMHIKASGTPLKAMAEDRGWVTLDQRGSVITSIGKQRPSMEWPMHLLLPRVVVHCHTIYANVFNCMVGGTAELAKILSDWQPIIIPYSTPGQELADSIAKKIQGQVPQLLILENHGLIICGETATETVQRVEAINAAIIVVLQQRLQKFTPFTVEAAPQFQASLFPDAAVFTGTTALTDGVKEILSANHYLHDTIQQLGDTVQPLPTNEGAKLKAMEQEQYRQQIVQ